MRILTIAVAALMATGATAVAAQPGPPPGPGMHHPGPGPRWHHWRGKRCHWVWRHHHKVRRCR